MGRRSYSKKSIVPLSWRRAKAERRQRGFSLGLPRIVVSAIALPVWIFFGSNGPQALQAANEVEGVVTHIVDGDTLYLSGTKTRIRLWGLDAPERNDARGPAATAALRKIADGRHLRCKKKGIDRYGRIVGQCFRTDGADIVALMIASGTAKEYVRYSSGYYSVRKLAGGGKN